MDDYFIPRDFRGISTTPCEFCGKHSVCTAVVSYYEAGGSTYDVNCDLCVNHLHLADDLEDDCLFYTDEARRAIFGS